MQIIIDMVLGGKAPGPIGKVCLKTTKSERHIDFLTLKKYTISYSIEISSLVKIFEIITFQALFFVAYKWGLKKTSLRVAPLEECSP